MRLDKYLSEKGFTKSREAAQKLIAAGNVLVNGKSVTKASFSVDETDSPAIGLVGELPRYVSRGGLKLEKALDEFHLDVSGLSALDVGASTGGFTDCLLSRGIASVKAIDVGRSQLDPKIAADRRVTSYEGVNARYLTPDRIGGQVDLAVCDVSFISLTLIFPAVRKTVKEKGRFVTLIKPQFEAGRSGVGKGGIVRDREIHVSVIEKVIASAEENHFFCAALTSSPIEGGDGNREYLALFDAEGGFDRHLIRKVVFGA